MRSAEPSFGIRVDTTNQIGTGHFMRCLALGGALRRRGAHVKFISRQIPTRMRELAIKNGHEVASLPPARCSGTTDELPHAHWLATSQSDDAEATIEALAGKHVDWLIVDHYSLDARWESALRQCSASILAIDDLADRVHECDMLLDQNLYDDIARYSSKVPTHCRLLLGPKYALLREEFREARASMRTRDGAVRRILILMGGVDADNLTVRAIDAVSQLPRSFDVDVVISVRNPAREDIAEACKEHRYALHVQPLNIAKHMEVADLAIGAGGSTLWERCCLGLPTICITEATNQVPIAAALHAVGAVVNLGDKAMVSAVDLAAALSSLIERRDVLTSLSATAGQLVDGRGTDRVVEILLECT